jgi:hypothetical protein
MGRITPAQAERLLAVANERTETVLALAACIAALFVMKIHGHDLLQQISHLVRSLLPEITAATRQMENIVKGLSGGLL